LDCFLRDAHFNQGVEYMLIDGLNLVAGSSATKLSIESGANLPANPFIGQLFFKAGSGLYYFDATDWIQIGKLGADGKLMSSELPAIAITDTYVVASQAAMLALTAQVGDIAVRSEVTKTFILQTEPATVLSNWVELQSPTSQGAAGPVGPTGSAGGAGPVGPTGPSGSASTLPCDIAWSVFGAVPANDVGLRFRAARTLTISNVQANGQARANVAATASTTFTIAKNGTSVGTIVFAAAGNTGTITIASAVSVAIGDLITVTGPAIADYTLADVDFTLVATLN
jgi:hypothetical protein